VNRFGPKEGKVMAMVFCRGCAKEIHETAPACPQCGASQHAATPTNQQVGSGSPWMSITSLVLGIICVLAMFDDSEWDNDTIVGLGFFSVIGLTFGIINITQNKSGHNMAIAGVILSVISLLISVSLFIQK